MHLQQQQHHQDILHQIFVRKDLISPCAKQLQIHAFSGTRFPGEKSQLQDDRRISGKQEKGETLPQTLHRELNEELGIDAAIGEFFMKSSYDYEFGHIDINCYFASVAKDKEISSNEHEAVAWAAPGELKNYTFAPADIAIVEALQSIKL